MRANHKKNSKKYWSDKITKYSNALDLEPNVFTFKSPRRIVGIAKCVNPKCITNHENITTKFIVINKEGIALKCEYCEKITTKKHIKILR